MKRATFAVHHSVDAQLQTFRTWKRIKHVNSAPLSLPGRLTARDPEISQIWENAFQATEKVHTNNQVAVGKVQDTTSPTGEQTVANKWRSNWLVVDNSMYPSSTFRDPHRVDDWSQPIRSLAPSNLELPHDEVDPAFISNPSLLESILATTSSPEVAWRAFVRCNSLGIPLPPSLMNRLSLLLLRAKPPSQKNLDRYREVIAAKQASGGEIHIWQWNALIRNLRFGLRTIENSRYLQAVDVLQDIQVANRIHQSRDPDYQPIEPTTVTYAAILDVAIATKNKENVNHALRLASGAGTSFSAGLNMMVHYHNQGDFNAARALIREFAKRNEDVGVVGASMYMWACARQGNVKVVLNVYKALRKNLDTKQPKFKSGWTAPVIRTAWATRTPPPRLINKDLLVFSHVKPNRVIYTCVIQTLAYWGRFHTALRIYRDMLTTKNEEQPWTQGQSTPCYEPSRAIFRAFFLGFVRFGESPPGQFPLVHPWPEPIQRQPKAAKGWKIQTISRGRNPEINKMIIPHDRGVWTFKNLETFFRSFMSLGLEEGPLPQSLVRCIMRAFDVTSGGDVRILKIIWRTMERRFGILTAPTVYRRLAEQARQEPNLEMTDEPLKPRNL